MAPVAGAWLSKKAPQPWMDGPLRLTLYLEARASATPNPSIRSAPRTASKNQNSPIIPPAYAIPSRHQLGQGFRYTHPLCGYGARAARLAAPLTGYGR